MRPTVPGRATLNDLLDRLLDKGVLLNTDLIISLAGIPLIGLNLRLALAGMATMLEFGLMKDWDEAVRAAYRELAPAAGPVLLPGESLVACGRGSVYAAQGILAVWRPGVIAATDRRLTVFRPEPFEMLLDLKLSDVATVSCRKAIHLGSERTEVCVATLDGHRYRLYVADPAWLVSCLRPKQGRTRARLRAPDPQVRSGRGRPPSARRRPSWLTLDSAAGEQVVSVGGAARLVVTTEGLGWLPGTLCLTTSRLCWRASRAGRGHQSRPSAPSIQPGSPPRPAARASDLEIPLAAVICWITATAGSGSAEPRSSLIIRTAGTAGGSGAVCLSPDPEQPESFDDWVRGLDAVLHHAAAGPVVGGPHAQAPCPACGTGLPEGILLTWGCPVCGWQSPRRRSEVRFPSGT